MAHSPISPITTALRTQQQDEFDQNMASFMNQLPLTINQMNTVGEQADANAASAAGSAGQAASSATLAQQASNATTALLNASRFVSGQNYAQDAPAISAVNGLTYRRKTAGSGATDPASDPTNWNPSVPAVTPTTYASPVSAVDIQLTNVSAGMQDISMTAPGKSVRLADATTFSVIGGPMLKLNNAGAYAFGVRDFAGKLLTVIPPGAAADVSLESKASAAGVWGIIGQGLEAGLIVRDYSISTGTALWDGTTSSCAVVLDDSTSIHFFKAAGTGFYAAVWDAAEKDLSALVLVSSVANEVPLAAFKVTSTQAIVFYGAASGGVSRMTLLNVTGVTPNKALTVAGTNSIAGFTAGEGAWGGESPTGVQRIVQMSPTLYTAVYCGGSGALMAASISVSGGATYASAVASIASTCQAGSAQGLYLSPTAVFIAYKSQGATYYPRGLVCTVSDANPVAPTCALAPAVNLDNSGTSYDGGSTAAPYSAVALSASQVIVAAGSSTSAICNLIAVTITGTTPAGATPVNISGLPAGSLDSNSIGASRFTPHLFKLSATTAALQAVNTTTWESNVMLVTWSGSTVAISARTYRNFSRSTSGHRGRMLRPNGDVFASVVASTYSTGSSDPLTRCRLTPHKISGSEVVSGIGRELTEVLSADATSYGVVRLANGDDLLLSSAPASTTGLLYSNNGEQLKVKGVVRTPPLALPDPHAFVVAGQTVLMLGIGRNGSLDTVQDPVRFIAMEVVQ